MTIVDQLWASAPIVEFWVGGVPLHAGNKTPVAVRRGGRIVMHRTKSGRVSPKIALIDQSGERGVRWREAVQRAARRTGVRIVGSEPIALAVSYFLPRPAKHFRTGRYRDQLRTDAPAVPLSVPDLNKLTRALEDALTGVLYDDDRLIVAERLEKFCADPAIGPGATVRVHCLCEEAR